MGKAQSWNRSKILMKALAIRKKVFFISSIPHKNKKKIIPRKAKYKKK